MISLGAVPAGTTIYVPFTTYAGSTGASVTCTGLAVTDIEIYKNGSVTQRSSDAGYTLLDTDGIDFDGITGLHGFSIDLNDNTDASFFAVGSWYWVVVSAITVDSQTVTFLAAVFRIAPAESVTGTPKVDTSHAAGTAWASGAITAASIASSALTADKFDTACLTSGKFDTGAITSTVVADGFITNAKFAAGAIDNAAIAPDAIGSSELAATAVNEIVDQVWDELLSGHVVSGSSGEALAAASAPSAATVAAAVWDAVQASHVTAGSFGEIATEIASILVDTAEIGAAGAGLTAVPYNASWDAEIESEVNDGLVAFFTSAANLVDLVWDEATSGHTTAGTTGKAVADAASGASPSAIADAVWDETLSGHLGAGSTGEALNAAGGAGDPWVTTLPGSYTGTQAGKILSDILVDTGTTLQGELDGIQADTEDIQSRLPAALVSGRIDSSVGSMVANTMTASALATDAVAEIQSGLSTIDAAGVRTAVGLATANLDTQIGTLATAANLSTVAGYLDTEIAAILADTNELQVDWVNGGRLDLLIDAIKAKTDNLPAAPAATGDIPTVSQIWTTALTEAFRATGATGTATQLLYEILQNITEFTIAGTTKTVKRLDGSTTAKTYTLNDGTTPTGITETT